MMFFIVLVEIKYVILIYLFMEERIISLFLNMLVIFKLGYFVLYNNCFY